MVIRNKYNYLGKNITTEPVAITDNSFGWVYSNGIPHINWGEEDDICDKDGFDKRYRPYQNGKLYTIDDYVIPRGTIICRYGSPIGRFTTLKGVKYEDLALPYIKETIEYHEYKV